MDKAIILCSGGFDSVATAYYVKNKLNPKEMLLLFFDYGQRTLKEEEFCCREISKKLNAEFKKIDLRWLGDISTALLNKRDKIPETGEKDLSNVEKEKKEILLWWVPCRNAVFALTGLAHAESEFISKNKKTVVYFGFKCEGEIPMKDTTPEFIKAVKKLSEEATYDGDYEIKAPFIEDDKDTIINKVKDFNVPWELTYSCYGGGGFKNNIPVHCGICPNCMQRKKAFYWAGVKDPSIYLK